jgi:hypothetical protein
MTALGWTLLMLATAAPGEQATTLEATTPVSGEHDRCLDHAVKELGMSARQVEKERRWSIGPQFLHPSIVPAGSLEVQMKPGEQQTVVQVTARWPGGPKDRAVQEEIESRVTAIASKLAQMCGVVAPAVRCTLGQAGTAPVACTGH